MPFGRVGRIEAILDVLNVLNDTAEEDLVADNSLWGEAIPSGQDLRGSAPRDGQREGEPRPVIVFDRPGDDFASTEACSGARGHRSRPSSRTMSASVSATAA
jgi:hypothetical protein